MPFDVTMPDGTVIRGVPDGTTKEQIAAKYQARTGKSPERGLVGDVAAYASGVARGLRDFDPAAALVNLGTRATDAIGLTDNANAEYQRVMGNDRGDKMRAGGRVVGQIAGSAPLAAAVPSVLAQGALAGALTSQAPTTGGFVADTLTGAATAKGTQLALGGAGRVLGGFRRTPEAQALRDAGVKTTIGQELGGRAKAVEDRLSGLPIVGGPIRQARRDGLESLMTAAGDTALAPIGGKVPAGVTGGRQVADEVMGQAEDAYAAAVRAMGLRMDKPLAQALRSAKGNPEAASLLTDEILPRMQAGALDGTNIQAIKEVLDAEARKFGMAPGGRQTAQAIKNLRTAILDAAERQSPAAASAYGKARQAYGMAKTVAKASSKSTSDGIPTPRQIGQAVREGANRFGPRDAYGRGNAGPLQALADNAAQVLPSSIPDPGTAGQLAFTQLLTNPVGAGVPALGAGVAGAAYSPFAQAIARRMLIERSAGMARAGQGLSQFATPAGRVAGIGVPLFLSGQ